MHKQPWIHSSGHSLRCMEPVAYERLLCVSPIGIGSAEIIFTHVRVVSVAHKMSETWKKESQRLTLFPVVGLRPNTGAWLLSWLMQNASAQRVPTRLPSQIRDFLFYARVRNQEPDIPSRSYLYCCTGAPAEVFEMISTSKSSVEFAGIAPIAFAP